MSLKIKQNGKVKDLIIPACDVQILDMEDNFESNNLEGVLREIGKGESSKGYLDKQLGTVELTTDDKTIKGAINKHEKQIKENTTQLSQSIQDILNITKKVEVNTTQLAEKANQTTLLQTQAQIDAFQVEASTGMTDTGSLELVATRTNSDGYVFTTSSKRINNIEARLSDLETYAETGNNIINTTQYEGMLFETVFSNGGTIYINLDYLVKLKNNINYNCKIKFTDGTYATANNSISYRNGTTTIKSIGLSSPFSDVNLSNTNNVKIYFNPTGIAQYKGKIIEYIILFENSLGEKYDGYKLSYKSNSVKNIISNLSTDNTRISTLELKCTQENLFNKDTVNKGKDIYGDGTIVDNANKFVSDFIPMVNTDAWYVANGSIPVSALVLYDSNKVRLGAIQPNFNTPQSNTQWATLLASYTTLAYVRFSDTLVNLNNIMISKSPIYKYKSSTVLPSNVVKDFNNTNMNFWEGKNGDSLGDSLTGQNFFQTYTKRYFNLSKFSNHGIGGTKLSGIANKNGDSMWMDSRINSLDVTADFVTVMGGANDGSVLIGDLTLENCDTNTYAGALNTLISKLYYKYQKLNKGYYTDIDYTGVTQVTTAKNILIFLCTPFYMPSENDVYRTKKLATAVREIAKLWSIPVVDFASRSMLNSGVADVYWGSDRTHPNEECHRDRLTPVLIGEMERFKPVDYTKCNYI